MQEKLNFDFKGNSYQFTFPNVGEYRNIESLKQALSNGMYSSMLGSRTMSSQEALDMIDMEATITVLCPKLIDDLKCDSFSELGLLDFKELKTIYVDKVLPWWNEIMDLLNPKK